MVQVAILTNVTTFPLGVQHASDDVAIVTDERRDCKKTKLGKAKTICHLSLQDEWQASAASEVVAQRFVRSRRSNLTPASASP